MSSKRSSCRRRLALTLAALLSSQTPVWAGTAFTDVSPADGIFQTPDTHDFWLASLTAADFDGDGIHEIYVASDNQGQLRRYIWNGRGYSASVIGPLKDDTITFNVVARMP